MKFRWTVDLPQPLLAGQLAGALKISPLLAQCLLNRGLSEPDRIEKFLTPRLQYLADPFLLPNMEAAVERLFRARAKAEPLVIFGDYDVDGVTATTLLLEVFGALGWKANSYLPNRLAEGYGLSQEGLENCLARFPVNLLLAVDCGSTSATNVAWLHERGVEVIILDHHQISDPAPDASALVNPLAQRVANGSAPFAELCSVGLAFKLAHALVKRGREEGLAQAKDFDVRTFLDLVALGTIADLVPLTGENRILVTAGLKRLDKTQRPGLAALKQIAQCPSPVGSYEVGFQLGPRLNAAGRLETAEEALLLLRTNNATEAFKRARSLDTCNRERQQIERSVLDQALASVSSRFKPAEDFVIVEGGADWHVGVVGIVAARVLQQFYRPTLILGSEGSDWRGSGRSVPGFDLAAALNQCRDLLVRAGGHAMAAGITINPSQLDAFRARLNDLARAALGPTPPTPPLRLDAEIQLKDLNLGALLEFARLQPSGQGNAPLYLCARGVTHSRPLQRLGSEREHVKMWITDSRVTHEAVWWRAGNLSLPVGTFDLAFQPQTNRYLGQESVQLRVLDWRASELDAKG